MCQTLCHSLTKQSAKVAVKMRYLGDDLTRLIYEACNKESVMGDGRCEYSGLIQDSKPDGRGV